MEGLARAGCVLTRRVNKFALSFHVPAYVTSRGGGCWSARRGTGWLSLRQHTEEGNAGGDRCMSPGGHTPVLDVLPGDVGYAGDRGSAG